MKPMTSIARHRGLGFTLVEVLIALVVLSIGMLGIAALYLDTLQASRGALLRTQAVALASDLGDRIVANRNPADAYNCGGDCASGEGGNAIAIADINGWLAAIADQLPGGTGAVRYVAPGANAPAQYMVTVGWTDASDATASSYDLRIER